MGDVDFVCTLTWLLEANAFGYYCCYEWSIWKLSFFCEFFVWISQIFLYVSVVQVTVASQALFLWLPHLFTESVAFNIGKRKVILTSLFVSFRPEGPFFQIHSCMLQYVNIANTNNCPPLHCSEAYFGTPSRNFGHATLLLAVWAGHLFSASSVNSILPLVHSITKCIAHYWFYL